MLAVPVCSSCLPGCSARVPQNSKLQQHQQTASRHNKSCAVNSILPTPALHLVTASIASASQWTQRREVIASSERICCNSVAQSTRVCLLPLRRTLPSCTKLVLTMQMLSQAGAAYYSPLTKRQAHVNAVEAQLQGGTLPCPSQPVASRLCHQSGRKMVVSCKLRHLQKQRVTISNVVRLSSDMLDNGSSEALRIQVASQPGHNHMKLDSHNLRPARLPR